MTTCGTGGLGGEGRGPRRTGGARTIVVHYVAVGHAHNGNRLAPLMFEQLKTVARGLIYGRIFVISSPDAVAYWAEPKFNLEAYTLGSESTRGGGLAFCPWSVSEVTLLSTQLDVEQLD